MTRTAKISYITRTLSSDITEARRMALTATLVSLTAGCCTRCGRHLTDPSSIARGIGPECLTKGDAR
jgi:hypothetical protein